MITNSNDNSHFQVRKRLGQNPVNKNREALIPKKFGWVSLFLFMLYNFVVDFR